MRPTRIDPAIDQESVWNYPRPPALVQFDRRVIVVEFAGETIADTTRALRVLETSHPPTYYLPIDDVRSDRMRRAVGASFCEWKGAAAYVDVVLGDRVARETGWYYPEPNDRYADLACHIAFYAGRVGRCTVADMVVVPQPGGFHGGWITPDTAGPFKGDPGAHGW